MPPSASETNLMYGDRNSCMTSTVPSVEAPSQIRYSRLTRPDLTALCPSTEETVSPINACALKHGVIIENRIGFVISQVQNRNFSFPAVSHLANPSMLVAP